MYSKKVKVAILTNIIPSYREGFYNLLFNSTEVDVTVFCQSKIKGFNHATIYGKYPNNVELVKYLALEKEKLVWQFIPYVKIFKNYDVIFIDGNPRILSQALFATMLKLLGKKVVIWSMVHSSWNNKFTENIRLNWLKFFKYHFLYNDADIVSLTKRGFQDKVMMAMNNGLDQTKIDEIIKQWTTDKLNQWKIEKGFDQKIGVVSCGRLEPNKYEDMVEAMPLLIQKMPNLIWFIIGEGTARQSLLDRAKILKVENNIHFVGALFNDSELAPWFLSSKLFVHPAAIGLSIMHAFGFGLPVITHSTKDEHGPEYVAFENNKTGKNYLKNNINDLVEKVESLLNDDKKLAEMSNYVHKIVREKYNTQIMFNRFVGMVKRVVEN
jgi:glycosyltransferase involved in cell wall biosynthesis